MPPDMDSALIGTIETIAYRTWPAEIVEQIDGWRVRVTEGVTRRANSVWPNAGGRGLAIDRKLTLVETLYAGYGLPARYQICPISQPFGLDSLLDQRGYIATAHTDVQIADLATLATEVEAPERGSVRIDETLDEAWFTAYHESEHMGGHEAGVRRGILRRIEPRSGYAALHHAGRPVSIGLGVVDGSWMGIFCMATREEYRRQGGATRIVRELARWGQASGARWAYLQVMRNNGPALALYQRLGFARLYGYHYRQQPYPGKDQPE